jgi:hypothetical protein
VEAPAATRMFDVLLIALTLACPRPGPPRSSVDRGEVVSALATFRDAALAPARIPPPSVSAAPAARDGGVVGEAHHIRAEEADWNRWSDGDARLFNNRAALVFRVRIEATGPLSWIPDGAVLELNDDRTALAAAPSAEVLLTDLLFHAYVEEQWAVEGDLVARTRAAGPFRAAYLPAVAEDGVLEGIVAFPLAEARALHVVAMRLTIPVRTAGGRRELVWIFD